MLLMYVGGMVFDEVLIPPPVTSIPGRRYLTTSGSRFLMTSLFGSMLACGAGGLYGGLFAVYCDPTNPKLPPAVVKPGDPVAVAFLLIVIVESLRPSVPIWILEMVAPKGNNCLPLRLSAAFRIIPTTNCLAHSVLTF